MINNKCLFICSFLLMIYSLSSQNFSKDFDEESRVRRKFSQNREIYSPKNKKQEMLQNPLQIINASVDKKIIDNKEFVVFNLVFNISLDPYSVKNGIFFINGDVCGEYHSLRFNRIGTQMEIVFTLGNNRENKFFSLKLKNIHSLNSPFFVELETEPMEVGTLYYKDLEY